MESNVTARIACFLKKDGWILAALCAALLLCLLTGNTDTAASSMEEQRIARVLSAMEGAGTVEVAIHSESTDGVPVPCGAVIVADGAADVAVRLRLTRAVSTLLGISSSRVEVFQRRGGPSHAQQAP